MKLTGENRSTRRKTCPSVNLSTTNATWTDPGSNPGLRVERPATNRLSYGKAKPMSYYFTLSTDTIAMATISVFYSIFTVHFSSI
jgi:hypothetical protein